MIGIIGAMDVEVDPLIRNLGDASLRCVSGMRFFHGQLRGREVVLVRGGVGKVNAALCAEAMILLYRPSLIVNVGVAGALSRRFHIGDIAVARDMVQYDVDTSALGDPVGMVSTVNRVDFPCAPWAVTAIHEAAQAAGFRAETVRFASGDRFNDSPEDKQRIASLFGAEVCEMEGCPIAQVCYVNGVECAALRGISDTTDGAHSAEYARYRDLAAGNASRVLFAFLDSIPGDCR